MPTDHGVARRHLLAGAGAAVGAGLLKALAGAGLTSDAAFAARPLAGAGAAMPGDVAAGQTAAAIESVVVAAYKQTASLPFMKTLPAAAERVLAAYLTQTVFQHGDHAKAFNDAVEALGGKAQSADDQALVAAVVQPALPGLKSALDVLRFLAQLELIAAETYAAATAAAADPVLRSTFASIVGVESQHRAALLAMVNLLEHNAAALLAIPTQPAGLPGSLGTACFPEAFLKVDLARDARDAPVP